MKFWKKCLIGVSVLLLLAVMVILWLGWSLGAHMSDDRQKRLQASSQYKDGGFVNVEPQAAYEVTLDYFREQFFGDQQRDPQIDIPVTFLKADDLKTRPESGLRATWLGHATVLLEIDSYRILTDPVLSERVSPFQFIGPKRFHPAPIEPEQLSGIDAVVLSHDHYDHLDETTVRHLAKQGTEFYVPLGIGAHLEGWGVSQDRIHEMDWWEEKLLGDITIVATPNRHYSGRGLFDYKTTLWASWSILGPEHRVFYSGDTGYSTLFRQIGDRFGPFDLTLIKIGAYGPGQAWLDVHMTPEDAIRVHQDVSGKQMLPVHWGSFNLAIHDWDEPIKRAVLAAEQNGIQLLTPPIGETLNLDQPFTNTHWWEKRQ